MEPTETDYIRNDLGDRSASDAGLIFGKLPDFRALDAFSHVDDVLQSDA
jgi:hypothetical protein